MRNPSKITSELAVDEPLLQNARFAFGKDDRQFLDNQVRGVQQHLVDALIRGNHATFFDLDPASAAVIAGDIVCLASSVTTTVTRVTSDALNLAKAASGVVLRSAAPGTKVLVAIGGVLPRVLTGLGPSAPGFVRANATTGRCERVDALSASDVGVGSVDNAGNLQVMLGVAGGGGGTANVADDVAKSAGTNIDRVRGHNGVPFRKATGAAVTDGEAPPRGGAWTRVGSAFIPDNPTPRGWYDPRHFGAKFDGQTDDILALEAMVDAMPATGGWVHWPDGIAWVSRTWVVTKPVKLRGQGGNDARHSGIMVAPGFTAIEFQDVRLNPSPSPTEVNGAAYFECRHISIESHILIAPDTSRGSIAGDRGLVTMNIDHALVRNGDLYVKPGNASPTRAFRASTPTAAAVLTSGSPPAWSDTLGATLTDAFGITWTTESVPSVRANNTAYEIGDRVLAPNDNRYYYECVEAGTSAESTPPPEFDGGHYGKLAVASVIGDDITDGGVTWRVKLAAGIYANATQGTIERVYVYRLTNYGIMVQAGTGFDARGNSDANNVRIAHVNGSYCGGILALVGDNCNGWTAVGVDGIKMGVYHPSATTFLDNGGTLPYPDGGRGGHIIFDASLGGGCVVSSYGQVSTGKPIVKRSAGRTVFLDCFDEFGAARPYFANGVSLILGGNIVDIDPDSNSVQVIDPAYGRGISEVDNSTGHAVHVQLTESANNRVMLRNRLNDSSQGGYALRYDSAAGKFLEEYYFTGPAAGAVAHQVYEYDLAAAGIDPGPGWQTFRDGFLIGRSNVDTGAIFVGHERARASALLRNGKRRAGDQFVNGTTVITLTSDGYRGSPWTTGAHYARSTTTGARGDMVEPTTNVDTPNGGGQVWECTTAGTSAGSEPTWPGSPTPDVTTVTDGSVTWTYRGTTPTYQTSVAREDRELTTTATTANQVIGTVTLPSAASGKVNVYRVFASFLGGGNAGRVTGKVEGSFEVSSAGAITRHGSDDVSTPKGTGAIGSSTFSINPTTNALQFRVTPGSATSTRWRVLVQLELLAGATA